MLSVPGVSRRKLLEDSSLDPGPDVTLQERKQLEAAGWSPGTTIRSLLNFSGQPVWNSQRACRVASMKPSHSDPLDWNIALPAHEDGRYMSLHHMYHVCLKHWKICLRALLHLLGSF